MTFKVSNPSVSSFLSGLSFHNDDEMAQTANMRSFYYFLHVIPLRTVRNQLIGRWNHMQTVLEIWTSLPPLTGKNLCIIDENSSMQVQMADKCLPYVSWKLFCDPQNYKLFKSANISHKTQSWCWIQLSSYKWFHWFPSLWDVLIRYVMVGCGRVRLAGSDKGDVWQHPPHPNTHLHPWQSSVT